MKSRSYHPGTGCPTSREMWGAAGILKTNPAEHIATLQSRGRTLLSAALEFDVELDISWLGSCKIQSQRRRIRASVLHVP
jgi:hypothetical protein